MTNKIVAIQGDHPSKLRPLTDTSIFLAIEAQRLKYKIFYYEPKDLSIINNKVVANGFYVEFNYSNKRFFKILNQQKLELTQCKYILIRQDPPFNLEYISTTYILDKIKNKILKKEINKINKFFSKNKKMIIKPIHSFSGNDIHLFQNKINKKLIINFIKKHGHIMCQKFLPKIKFGDKRVFIIDGKVCGAISRVPKKGSFLSNMSKGAIPISAKLTKLENKISNIIGKDLKKNDIYFSGIDFIDQKLNGYINVTSPTGLKSFYDLTSINLAKTFWKGLKA